MGTAIKVSLAALALGGVAWASAEWSSAKTKAEEFDRKDQELRKRAPEETRKIVAAVCAARQDGRKSAASSASSDARRNIADKFSELERLEHDAINMLEDVQHDDKQKDRHNDASSLASEIKSKWDKTKDLTHDLRDERPPVVEWMLSHGESGIHDRESHCDARDISVSGDHAACLMASGETCRVIEYAPDNSNAISSARDHARRVKSDLEDELKKSSSDVLKELQRSRSDFAKCKHFEAQVECYKQCPEVGDDNRFRETSASWRSGC
jgi:vacuolar-type H+-ATPase subunit H